jgi:hypothetical protein
MSNLSRDQRNLLARITLDARDIAERGAAKALEVLAVAEKEPLSHLNAGDRQLRVALRAQAVQLGDEKNRETGRFTKLSHLEEKIAYDQYHRMLFARFLAENDLLISPDHGISVSIEDCRDLAQESGVGDGWQIASAFAAKMLPQIFRDDDPAGQIRLAPEDRNQLQQLVLGMPREIFLADDSLGWVYQYWQAKRKEEINHSEKKIGADELAPVTQLFTEDYMVSFLLHNTLGAWWVAKRNTEGKSEGLPGIAFTYLKRSEDGLPVAGSFDGWPGTTKELRILDPCMGSGHFLAFALPILAAMRAAEESQPMKDAIAAVLGENIFGLEIDPRCTQIAAFNVALVAWKLGGYQILPAMNLACCGLGIHATEEQWRRLANGDEKLANGMSHLYKLFRQAPILGSLIDPRRLPVSEKAKGKATGDLLIAEYHDLQPLLEKALDREKIKQDFDLHEMGVVAQGLAKAAELMVGTFHLVTTNVPYLGSGKQNTILKEFCESQYPAAKADLATVFVKRSLQYCTSSGSIALVTPQNWLFLGTYKKLREELLRLDEWNIVTRLGPKGFQTPMWDFNIMLLCITRRTPQDDHQFMGMDVSAEKTPADKDFALQQSEVAKIRQKTQLSNPFAVINFSDFSKLKLLGSYARSLAGMDSGDSKAGYSILTLLRKQGITEAESMWFFMRMEKELCIDARGRVFETLSSGARGE